MKSIVYVLIVAFALQSCVHHKNMVTAMPEIKSEKWFDSLFQSASKPFQKTIAEASARNIQIIYTQINRNGQNQPSFTHYTYHVNDTNYFYPASTVKMPTAFVALEKLNELRTKGIDSETPMITDSSHAKQMVVYNDAWNAKGVPSIADYVKQIFLVSDNQAYNRLYEFCGQEYLNQTLRKKGYPKAQLLHRLEMPLTAEENKYTNEVKFLDTAGNTLYTQSAAYSQYTPLPNAVKLGKGYLKGGKLVPEPFDFSAKNRFPLQELHKSLQAFLFPESVSKNERFNIAEPDRNMVLQYMSMYPTDSKYPNYPAPEYWPNYCKFLLTGSSKTNLPPSLKIFNKVGDAYGFLLDVAYIIDTDKQVEFMLSTVIGCNSDGIFNDNKYEYDEVGFPYMKELGEIIYQYECNRERKNKPNFAALLQTIQTK